MTTGKTGAGRRPRGDNGYDADLINTEALAVCDHYLNERRREGRRYVYRCPDCGKLDFEVEPVKGLAGCFNPGCAMPKTTNALGIISHLEGLESRGAEFIRCMEKGYEILGLALPSEAVRPTNGKTENGSRSRAEKDGSITVPGPRQHGTDEAESNRQMGRKWVRQNGTRDPEAGEVGPAEASSGPHTNGSAVPDRPPEERPGRPAPRGERAYPIEAYFEGPDGEMIPTEAVIVEDADAAVDIPIEDDLEDIPISVEISEEAEDPAPEEPAGFQDGQAWPEDEVTQPPPQESEKAESDGGVGDARLFDRAGPRAPADDRELRHAVYERLLALCPLEKRDADFLEGRGLDRWTITQGGFGSISARRSRWAADKLSEVFGEDLLRVPGFYRPEADPEDGPRRGPGGTRFSLYGDYALIPYHDADGYITTVEGRLIGEPKNKRDKKYKALLNSGVHLYVHPRFGPGEVVAFCEGAIGAMVAARYGIPVAAIKGFRNYKVSARERGDEDTVLPELEGVDFAGRTVVYIPDVDVKPASREEVMEVIPAACEWLISRQGGIPKVALLPEGAKDLDAWLLSLPEPQRHARAHDLLSGAVGVEEWTDSLGTGQDQPPGDAEGEKSNARRPSSGTRAANVAHRAGGPDGRSRLLGDDEDGPPAAVENAAGGSHSTAGSASQATEDTTAGTPPSGEERDPRKDVEVTDQQDGPEEHRGGTSSGTTPAAHDPERARKGPMHPAMARWYEVAAYTDEQVVEARRRTVLAQSSGKRRPPVRDTPVKVPRWTVGEVILSLAAGLLVAAAFCAVVYAMRTQEGPIGLLGAVVTWPAWWYEAALYAWVGVLAAGWTADRRHRARGDQLRAHLRGEE